ncbi:GDSL-type esterase/lipase family protein [Maribacter chungangensis]|uniref:GDSL-type esterase/lipase family protein n=1 Tax=Maribacter chungangensis TaxID=1069117 RepID=A0ABW3B6G6_9FLAO
MGIKRRTFIQTSAMAAMGTLLWNCNDADKILLKKGQTIACLGDSITATPNGYVQMLQDYVDTNHPDLELTFLNWGKSSETITGLTEKEHPGPRPYLFERLDGLLKSTQVDILFFCYGINCGIYGKPSQTLFDSYTIGIYTFLEKIKQKGIKTILLTPPPVVLEAVNDDSVAVTTDFGYQHPYPKYQEEVLQEFREIVLAISHETVLGKIDIQAPLLRHKNKCYLDDPIHPNKNGHQLITNTIVENLTI